MAVCLGLVVALLVAVGTALSLGDYPLPLDQLVATLVGQGTTASNFIVLDLRLPRVLTGLLVGAGFGMLFGVISYALTGGRRDFTSASQIVAGEYTVLCLPQMAGQARQVLSKLPNGLGRPQGAWQQPQHPTPYGQPQDGPGAGQGPAQGTPAPPAESSQWGAPWGSPSGSGPTGSGSSGSGSGSHAAGGPQGSYGPPPQAGTGPATAPPPPAGVEPAPVEMDLSGPTYAQKIEEQRQQRRAAEQRAREEQGSGDQRDR